MSYLVIGLLIVGALVAVAIPFFKKPVTDVVMRDDAALEEMVGKYRVALKAGTVCDRCLRDNPEGSKFCADCGTQLRDNG